MAGNALAGLAAKYGTRASNAVGRAKGSVFGVAEEAVKGQYAAEAQERAHGHTRKILNDVHKKSGQGGRVDIEIGADGNHRIGYSKKMIGENLGEAREAQAVKDFKASNRPSRTPNGFRKDQPDHVGNARAAIEAKPMEPTKLMAVKDKPKAASVEEQPDSTRQFVNDPKTGTRSVDRTNSSFEANLGENEAKYLAEKQARLSTIKQAGLGMKSAKAKKNPV